MNKECNVKKITKNKFGYINPSFNSTKRKHIDNSSLSVDDYITGIRNFDRKILGKAISLIESTKKIHKSIAEEVVEKCFPFTGNSLRIGLSGIPGAGKSTFIDRFGALLLKENKKIAVLAIDPSSKITKGSILADKTRMSNLSKSENVFIRPSPTSGILGGIAQNTRESIILCEAAGFDVILVETVGTGQSELTVHSLVDVFLLLYIAGGGDELQAMKKGILEMADFIIINKEDGDNILKVKDAKKKIESALNFSPKIDSDWVQIVKTCSAKMGNGLENIWYDIQKYFTFIKKNNYFSKHRKTQQINWMYDIIYTKLKNDYLASEFVKASTNKYENAILERKIAPHNAAKMLVEKYYKNL